VFGQRVQDIRRIRDGIFNQRTRSFAGNDADGAWYNSFGGLAVNCTAGDYSFGGGNPYIASFDPGLDGGGIFTGTLIGCVMGKGGAGMDDGADVPTGTITGHAIACRVTHGAWDEPTAAHGHIERCINADGTIVTYGPVFPSANPGVAGAGYWSGSTFTKSA